MCYINAEILSKQGYIISFLNLPSCLPPKCLGRHVVHVHIIRGPGGGTGHRKSPLKMGSSQQKLMCKENASFCSIKLKINVGHICILVLHDLFITTTLPSSIGIEGLIHKFVCIWRYILLSQVFNITIANQISVLGLSDKYYLQELYPWCITYMYQLLQNNSYDFWD